MQIKEIAEKLGLNTDELKSQPSPERVMTCQNSYLCDENGNVVGLNLSGNELTDAQIAFLWKWDKLQALNLSQNQLNTLTVPAGMGELQFLDLSENEALKSLTFKNGLSKLEKLEVSECQLSELILPLGFENLQVIYAQKNQLSKFEIKEGCPRMKLLDLTGNKMEQFSLPDRLPALELLYLQNGNKVSDVSFLAGAPLLQTLNLHGNAVMDISPLRPLLDKIDFKWEKSGNGVLLEDCPLTSPPPEIVSQGNEAILNYFQERDAQGADQLFEAKLLIVGEGGAGKTSLCRRLFFPDQDLPESSESTKGIDIHHYSFKTNKGKDFRINVWDFGGQQIYHTTHQFFLTKSSLYILLDDTRKNHTSVHDEDFKYWLEVVDLLSDHSPLLIFQNEKGGRSKSIDMRGIQGMFSNVKELFKGDLLAEPRQSVEKIRRNILYRIQELPHVGESLPKKWIEIRSHIEKLADEHPYISKGEYLKIYKDYMKEDFEVEKALLLSRYFHDLGVFLHFQEDDLLDRTVILQNTWATEAVFKILDDEKVKERYGRFTNKDCKRVWGDSIYVDKHPELRSLMEKFELCYQLPDSKPRTWLAPQMLSPEKPIELVGWEKPGDLILRYKYDFLPKGLISRLMVRNHQFVNRPDFSWQSGVLFEKDGAALLAQISPKGNEISLRSRGLTRKDLLSSIATDLDALNKTFPGLPEKVSKLIPCNCKVCLDSENPEFFPQKRLLRYKSVNRDTIECRNSFEQVLVLNLLDGIKLKLGSPTHPNLGWEREKKALEKELEALIEKKAYLSEELSIVYNKEEKFSLQKKVKELELQISVKKQKLLEFERHISPE